MPAPESTFNQFAIDKLLAPTADVLKPDMSVSVPKFEVPQVGYGNIDFPYGYSKNKHVDNPVAASVNKLFSSGPTQNFMGSPVTYNADEINAARYVVSPDYHKLGISLTGNNEENYGQNQSWSEVLSNGAVGMGKLAYNGFVDGWKGWGRMTDALVHWDWDKLHGDSESMMDMDNTLKDIMNLNPIYATKQGSDTFWNRQTFGNFLQQSGFAVGAGLQMLSEQVITKAIEAGLTATGVGAVGAGALEVIEDVNTAAKVGRIARMFQKGKEFYDAAKNFKVLKKAGDIFTNEKLLTNFVTGIAEKIPGVDIAMDISKTYEAGKLAGLSGGKLAGDITKVGLGGLKRTLSEANFAFTEARMEAAGTFTDMYNQLQDDYFKKTGKYATDDTLQGMQDVAMKAADKNFNFNSALLAVSNRIMFDNIFKNSKATSKILSQFGEDVGEKGLKVLGEINGRTTTQYYTGSAFSNFKTISEDFGIKKARKVLAGSVMKGALKFETTEGIQELLQEGSSNYFKDYYTDSYNSKFNPNIKADKTKSFNKAVESQMNMQGLKTFASGALTGLMLHGPTVLLGKAASKIGTSIEDKYKTQGFTKEQTEKYYEDKKTAKEEEKNKYVEFNAIAKDPSKFFSESVKNFNIQKEAASALNEAAKVDDKFAYENIRTDALHSMIASSIRNDTHEGLLDTLREYGKHLTKEEFEQAFVGLDYTSENKKATSDYTNKVANSIESYIKIKNKLNSKYGTIANPNRYAFGTEEFHKELIKKQTLDNMIDVIAGNEFKAADALERSTRIFSTLASHKTLGNSLSSAFNILGSEDALQNELDVLDAEINIKKQQLETEGLSKQDKNKLKKEIILKEKQHKNIVKWSENKLITTNKVKIGKAQSSFKAYLELKNEEYGRPTTINQDEIDDMFFAFNDYIKLNKKSQDHVNAINMLTNPDYFDQIHDRMIRAATLARFKMMAEAAEEHIKTNKDGEFFVIKIDNSFVLFSPTGEPIEEYDTIEEANKIKRKLNKSVILGDELNELFGELEVKETDQSKETEKPEEKNKEESKKPLTKPNSLLVNGKIAIITAQEKDTENNNIVSYYYKDDIEKEINNFTIKNGKAFDTETGELLTISKIENKEKPTEKSIDEKIAELQAKIDALPNKGIVMEGEMITSSKEFKDLNKQIEDLKKQQDLETETTTSDIEAKKADIERRRQEELDKINQRIEKLKQKEDRRVKTETYRTLDINDNPVEIEISTNADGSRLLRARQINEDGSVEPIAYVTERINNKAQATLTNEQLVEVYIGNEGNTLKRTNVDENPDQTYIDKINAKYDAELAALEGKTPITEEELEEEEKGVEDIDQTFNDKKDKIDGDSLDSEKIFQEGVKQTAPALSLGNTTHFVNVVQVSPAFERFERGEVNKTYEFEVATPTFMPGKSITFKVDEFDDKDFDKSNIGIYSIINGKETRIGAVHTPQWISEQRGSNDAYTHIVIPENEKNDKLPKTLQTELETNRKLRKLILDNHKLDSNFVLNGIVNDKSNGIVVTTEKAGLLKDRINPEVGKGGLENRHGMFGIIRNGYIEISKGVQINADQLADVKSFHSSNIGNYEGYSVLLVPTPTGLYFPTFMKIPNVAREQSEFILKAWKIFTGKESGNEFIKAVYTAQGSVYVENSTPNINILKDYINHYITNLSSKSLSQIGNGEDAPDNISRMDIFDDGNIKLQGKKNGKWISVTIRKEQDIPSDVLDYMDGLLTSVRFTDNKNDNFVGINSEDKFTLLGVKNDKLISNNTTYNKYIMDGAMTYLDKGIESKNADKDWVYFANPVVKFQYSEPSKDSLKDAAESKKPEVNLSDVTETPKVDIAAALLAALKANSLKNKQVDDQKDNCSGIK